MKEARLTIRINEELLDKVKFNAKLNGRTIADYVTNCLQVAVGECESIEARITRLETALINKGLQSKTDLERLG